MRRDPVIAAADWFTRVTGADKLLTWEIWWRPRPFRFLPIIALTLGAVGLALHIGHPDRAIGITILTLGCFWPGMVLMLLGPLRQPSFSAPLDEREQRQRLVAFVWGLGTAQILALIACYIFAVADLIPGLWRPRDIGDWSMLAQLMLGVVENVTVLAASWTLPRPLPEDD